MTTNEDAIARALREGKAYDVLRWVSPSDVFILANEITDPFVVHLCAVDGYAAWCQRKGEGGGIVLNGHANASANCWNTNPGAAEGGSKPDQSNIGAFFDSTTDSGSSHASLGEFFAPACSEDDTLCVTLQMFHMDMPITPLLQSSQSRGSSQVLDEWVIFPIAVCDIPLDALVQCHVYAPHGLVGRTVFYPFTACGELKTGPHRYPLCTDNDEPLVDDFEDTSGNTELCSPTGIPSWGLLTQDLQRGLIQSVPWMDKLVKQRVMGLEAAGVPRSEATDPLPMMLSIVFPLTSNHQRAFLLSTPREKLPASVAALVPPLNKTAAAGPSPFDVLAATPKQPYVDLYVGDENLCEAKAAVLSKSVFLLFNTDAQPGPIERRQLKEIAQKPLIHLEELKLGEEMLLWQFRYFLTRDPAYFVPFMRSVNWSSKTERQEALRVMQQWKPISFSQALVCLSFYFREVVDVRNHAIGVLDKQPNERLQGFLIQLVQGVRYDVNGELEAFLVRRAADCWEICSNLFWYVLNEASLDKSAAQESLDKGRYATLLQNLKDTLQRKRPHLLQRLHQQQRLMNVLRELYTSLTRENRDRVRRMEVAKTLIDTRKCGIRELFSSSLSSSTSGEAAENAVERGVAVTLPTHPKVVVGDVTSDGFYMFKSAMMPIKVPLVLHPEPISDDTGCSGNASEDTAHATLNSPSAAVPRPEGGLLFKVGDDVRQDQLVVQLIHLIDTMLRQDGLDLCLCPYRVIATGPTEGLVELIPNVVTLQSVQRDITGFIRSHNQSQEEYAAAMSRFTKSCAGYCVLTFILGIGDRHLENILLTHDGRLLHIDFGYILGNDPKPFPPPMKINKEMVEALGGPQSDGYMEFKTYCCSSYNIIRDHAKVILSMLLLMVDASIPHISGNGKVDPRVNLLKVQEKLRLDLSNAEASQYIQNVIADSVGSIFTNLWDVLHAAAQARRG
uniref:phosphatidylinositol 3-kinase n=1 Tax=Trypanosoma congolense (strain IL3000) TaxID=1068625 RepID=G0USL5_TRYCI|nr:unnamed protein product [Trypanosoma congolense IL3000]